MEQKNKPFPNEDHLLWKEVSVKQIADCRIFKVTESLRENARGKQVKMAVVDAPDWVCIIPVVKKDGEDHCIMVRQFRQGSKTITQEFPAGTNDPGEEPLHAATRELLEETGVTAGKMTLIGHINPNPAFMNNNQYFYLAEDLQFSGTQDLDEDEVIDYYLVPLQEVKQKMGQAPFNNGTMMSALIFLLRYRGEI